MVPIFYGYHIRRYEHRMPALPAAPSDPAPAMAPAAEAVFVTPRCTSKLKRPSASVIFVMRGLISELMRTRLTGFMSMAFTTMQCAVWITRDEAGDELNS